MKLLPAAAVSPWTPGAEAAGEPRGKDGDASRACNLRGSQRPETRDQRRADYQLTRRLASSRFPLWSQTRGEHHGSRGGALGRQSDAHALRLGGGRRAAGKVASWPPSRHSLPPQVLARAGRLRHPLTCDFSFISLKAHTSPWVMWLQGGDSPSI